MEQLLEKSRAEEAERRKAEGEKLKSTVPPFQHKPAAAQTPSANSAAAPSVPYMERKDAPPFRVCAFHLSTTKVLMTETQRVFHSRYPVF